jgi:hypothetical protein
MNDGAQRLAREENRWKAEHYFRPYVINTVRVGARETNGRKGGHGETEGISSGV